MFELIIRDHIASAHLLRGYPGKCQNLHGHTWKVEVSIQRQDLDELGMVADFAELKKQLKDFLEHLDHTNLNDIDYFKTVNPTAENLAKYIYDRFSKEVQPLALTRVTVWESERCSASYSE